MTGDLHLIERMGHMKRIDKDSATWESGWWAIAPETAEKLVEGRIFFHKAQDKPSFFGGKFFLSELKLRVSGREELFSLLCLVLSIGVLRQVGRAGVWRKKLFYPHKPSNKGRQRERQTAASLWFAVPCCKRYEY